jgi:HSP20 family protein
MGEKTIGTGTTLERREFRPLNLFEDLRQEMESFFANAWYPRRLPKATTAWLPTMDVFEKNGKLMVHADLPGLTKKDISITFEENDLVLRGERKDVRKVEEDNVYRAECAFGTFYRRLPLPVGLDVEKIEASFKDGVLEIEIPLPKGKVYAKEIPIH